MRQKAKKEKDPVEYVYKIVLNSAYGKFGQDPSNYSDVVFMLPGDLPDDDLDVYTPWKRVGKTDDGFNVIWEREKLIQDSDRAFINVGTAASITGAARANLIDAIGAVINAGGCVHYCDTDSIAFEGAATMQLGSELGQWKIEANLNRLVIAGPKLYAFCDADTGKYKVASKGVRTDAQGVIDLVSGCRDLTYFPEMGSFDRAGVYKTVKRTIKSSSLKR
jgi:hypothetical protein